MVNELLVKVYLLKDIKYNECLEKLGRLLNSSFLDDKYLKELHGKKGYKGYVFGNLFPAEKNSYYIKGKVYSWTIRSVDGNFIDRLKKVIKNVDDDNFVIVLSEKKIRKIDFVEKLVTLNPVFLTVESSVVDGSDVLKIKALIEKNGEKKYKDLVGDDISNKSWLKGLVVTSNTPLSIDYKGKKMLGWKYVLYVKEDELSQSIAKVVIGSGVGEKNSVLGGGFVHYFREG